MVENTTTNKQLILMERTVSRLIEEKEILLKRFEVISNADLGSFMKPDMSDIEESEEYLGTIQGLQLNSIENRLIQLEGEIEGSKAYVEELKTPKEEITNDSK